MWAWPRLNFVVGPQEASRDVWRCERHSLHMRVGIASLVAPALPLVLALALSPSQDHQSLDRHSPLRLTMHFPSPLPTYLLMRRYPKPKWWKAEPRGRCGWVVRADCTPNRLALKFTGSQTWRIRSDPGCLRTDPWRRCGVTFLEHRVASEGTCRAIGPNKLMQASALPLVAVARNGMVSLRGRAAPDLRRWA